MQVKFYGVRGSVPSPGPHTCVYGGNTSCVEIKNDQGHQLILDSGTGIIALGDELIASSDDIHLLLTHNHWDHIQGFPFFKPIYQPNRNIHIYPGQVESQEYDAILQQMSGSNFPVKHQQLPSNITVHSSASAQPMFKVKSFNVSTKALNHPDGGTAYLIENSGVKVAYVTDNELLPPYEVATTLEQWQNFISGVDLLIHDGQFVGADLPEKLGWGHSTVEQVLELAATSGVNKLALISHDPFRTDKDLAEIELKLQSIVRDKQYKNLDVFCAKEGMIFNLLECERGTKSN